MIWAAVTNHGNSAAAAAPAVASSGVETGGRWDASAGATGARRHRYARSSTASSVTQLLSESCSSLLQRLTTRVRGPSSTADCQTQPQSPPCVTTPGTSSATATAAAATAAAATFGLGSTRSRLEDKYSAVLKQRRPERDKERVREKGDRDDRESERLPLLQKSSTNVQLSRDSPPTLELHQHRQHGHSHHHHHHHHRHHRHKSDRGPVSAAGPLASESRTRTRTRTRTPRRERYLPSRLCPVEIPLSVDEPATTPADDERQAKRQEIQSLILKYSALDEAYSRLTESKRVLPEQHTLEPQPHLSSLQKHKHILQPHTAGPLPTVSWASSWLCPFSRRIMFIATLILSE